MTDELIGRRDFLRIGATAGGGILLGMMLPDLGFFGQAEAAGQARLNAFVSIAPDGLVTLTIPKSEMGQGVLTALAQLLAEELEADWERIRVEEAPAAKEYVFSWGMQMTAGSDSIRSTWTPLRKAGAAARALLIETAATAWGVAPAACKAEKGAVIGPAGKRLDFGALAEKAAARKPDSWTFGRPEPTLKAPADFKLIGKPFPRLDSAAKLDGSAIFGLDVQLPYMLVACVARCPVFGGKVASYSADAALKMPGVLYAVRISSGIAVVADSYWTARQGVEALEIKWADGPGATRSSADIAKEYAAAVFKTSPRVGEAARDVVPAATGPRLEALFELPYLAHAPMEPPNATARVTPDRCEIWAPTQVQTAVVNAAASFLGLPHEAVVLHTTLLGGGFGRKAEVDFVMEAVEIAKQVGRPVKVVWSREDDLRHGFYRPAATAHVAGSLDAEGWPASWTQRTATQSILQRMVPVINLVNQDPLSTEGAANMPYAMPRLRVDLSLQSPGVPVGFWRSVGFSFNTFIVEHFLDELAKAGKKDPLQLRRRLLARNPRTLACLDAVAEMADWGTPPPAGRHRGVAVGEPFDSHCAEIAEISIKDGEVHVHKVWCAIDCGQVVNPGIAAAQAEGGIAFGLSAALSGEITLDKGRVQQGNFDDHPLLRMSQMPEVAVKFIPSAAPPTGMGEISVPLIAPAVANAVLAATGKPVHKLPIKLG